MNEGPIDGVICDVIDVGYCELKGELFCPPNGAEYCELNGLNCELKVGGN